MQNSVETFVSEYWTPTFIIINSFVIDS